MKDDPVATTELEVVISRCTHGLVLIAVGARGIRAVLLGDDPTALRAELAQRIPGVSVAEASRESREQADAVVAHLADPSRTANVELDLRGTEFQRAVWGALREIPAGATTTYTAIAHRVGRPAAVRAVAQACAANAHAVLVPCHRVVRRDGGLSGYRWGVERKRALLAAEGQR